MDILEKLKNPWVIGGGVALGAVLLLMRSGGSNPSTGSNLSLASQQISSSQDTALGLAALQSQTAQGQTYADLLTNMGAMRTKLASDTIGANLQGNLIATQERLSTLDTLAGYANGSFNTLMQGIAELNGQNQRTIQLANSGAVEYNIVGTESSAQVAMQAGNNQTRQYTSFIGGLSQAVTAAINGDTDIKVAQIRKDSAFEQGMINAGLQQGISNNQLVGSVVHDVIGMYSAGG